MARFDGTTDILEGLARWSLWTHMGWMDIVRRYRRTIFGPFWNTISVAVFIGVTGFMYSSVFNQDVSTYLPYLSAGFTVWVPLSTFVTESASAFISGQSVLQQTRVPYTVFVLSTLVRNGIVFLHNLTVFIVVAILFSVDVNMNSLYALPAILVLLVNGLWVGLLVSLVCTRYRDLQQLVGSILQIVFFITPIFWYPSQAGRAQLILVMANPAFHFVDLLRAPMLGQAPSAMSWTIALGFTAFGWAITLMIFNKYKNRIVFWF